MRNRCMKYCCMNNNMQNMNTLEGLSMMEEKCNNVVSPSTEYNNNCSCGFDDDYEDNVFPENPMLGQSYVPIQTMNETFKPYKGLKHGTIFPELVSPYMPGDSMKQIEYIQRTNSVKEGCNKCQ